MMGPGPNNGQVCLETDPACFCLHATSAASCTAAGAYRAACAPQATKRVVPYLFVRGDGVILVSPPLRS